MYAELTRSNLIAIAEIYAQARGVSLAAVSKEFYGNGVFFANLSRRKLDAGLVVRVDKLLAKFGANWPKNVPVPSLPWIDMTYGFGENSTRRGGGGEPNRLTRPHGHAAALGRRGRRRRPADPAGQGDAAPAESLRGEGRQARDRGGRGTPGGPAVRRRLLERGKGRGDPAGPAKRED